MYVTASNVNSFSICRSRNKINQSRECACICALCVCLCVCACVCVCSANFFCKQAMIVSLLTVEHINLCSGYCRGGNDLCPNRQSQRE